MSTQTTAMDELVKGLDVPDSAYEAAGRRYEDLGKWLHDPQKADSAVYGPLVSPQGSFRLGTTVKPYQGEDYDLDMAFTLTEGFSKQDLTQ